MARDFSRRIDSIVSRPASPGSGVLSSLGRTLMARRDARRTTAPKAAPAKLTLTTTKEKQQVIEEMMTNKLPSALSLLKLRQRAAKGEVLGQKARDFLNRSQAGKKLESREALEKYTEEALEAELEATAQDPHSPIHYKLRQDGSEHLKVKAKGILREIEREHRVETAAPPSAMDIRRQRLSVLHGIHESLSPTPAPAPAVSRPSMPVFQTPMPLTLNESTPRAGGMIFATGTPGVRPSGTPTTVVVPSGHGSSNQQVEPTATPSVPDASASAAGEPAAPRTEPTTTDSPEPDTPPVPEPPSVSDALGGSGEDE